MSILFSLYRLNSAISSLDTSCSGGSQDPVVETRARIPHRLREDPVHSQRSGCSPFVGPVLSASRGVGRVGSKTWLILGRLVYLICDSIVWVVW